MGVTVKSGWAAVVVLAGTSRTPQVCDSRRVDLSDPAVPDSRQPYHDGFATARRDGPVLTRLLGSVRTFGTRSVTEVVGQCAADGHRIAGIGIVAGSLIDPARIANEHIRIHAREGQLFRGVVEEAARANGIPCRVWRERDLDAAAAGALKRPEADLRAAVAQLGKTVTGSWRAEQKAAAAAAWLMLASPYAPSRSDIGKRSM